MISHISFPTTSINNNRVSWITQVVGCTKNMIRTVRKMKAEGKSLEPNFKGGTRKIGREWLLDKGPFHI